MARRYATKFVFALVLSLGVPAALVAAVTVPNTFVDGAVASADAVNENFAQLAGAITALQGGTAGDFTVGGQLTSGKQIRAVPSAGSVKLNESLAIDWNEGNLQTTSADCGAVTFSNMLEGGAYTLIVTGSTSATCTFAQNAPDTLSTFRFQPANGATIAGKTTVYTFLRANDVVYVSWISGF